MSNVKKKIIDFIKSPHAPEFLFQYYFDRLAKRDRRQLEKILTKESGFMDHLEPNLQKYWRERIDDVLSDPANEDIPRQSGAGELSKRQLRMHNGLVVDPLSYYNFPLLQMLVENKGVHEPQEEKIFQEVLKTIQPAGQPTMLELGSYWSFYSMWFKQNFPQARSIMVEPKRRNLFYGKENFKLNRMDGEFIQAGIGKAVDRKNNIITVDQICDQKNIQFIDMLHSDIQGFELDMLHGCEKTLSHNKVGYIFISTHSNELHSACRELLDSKYGFSTVAQADLDQSYSWDGILVMKASSYPGPNFVRIDTKPTHEFKKVIGSD